MKLSALCQVRTMICLHDWEFGIFRFLSGQVFFSAAKLLSVILVGKRAHLCSGLTWVFFPLLFLLHSYFFSLSPPQYLNTCAPYERSRLQTRFLINIRMYIVTRKSINFFSDLCVLHCVWDCYSWKQKCEMIPVFFRFPEANSVEYTPVRWNQDSTQSRGSRNIIQNILGTNFNLSWSVHLTPQQVIQGM